MKSNKLIQTENTKKFIRYVKNLLESGIVEKQYMIAEKIGLNTTLLSSIMNGSKQVPPKAFKKFTEVYQPIEVKNQDNLSNERQVKIEVMCEIILSTLGEVLANQRGQTVKTISDDLAKRVNDELIRRL